MLLKFVKEGQKTTIVFGCDRCHRVIPDLSQAIFAWRVDRKTRAMFDGIIAVYHNDTCDSILLDNNDEENPELWLCEPLSRFPTALLDGLGITWEQVRAEQTERPAAE